MGHFFQDLFIPLAYSLFTLVVAYCIGFFVFKKIKVVKNINLLSVGVPVLFGYGILGYLSVIWTFFVPLNRASFLILAAPILILSRDSVVSLFKKIKSTVVGWKSLDTKELLFFIVVILFFLFYLTSALIPPHRTDAIAYHIPEAIAISQNGIVGINAAGNLYGPSPVLLESLYSLLYILSDYVLINLVHYQLLLAGLLVIYYFAREQFGKLSAQFLIIFIFSLYEIFVNATSAYIDAGMVAYQVASIVLVIMWSKSKDRSLLVGAGILYGLALSIKYLSLYALLLILPFIIFTSFTSEKNIKSILKDLLYFAIPALLFSGFWYIKNLILFGNPFYPFIFAHPGFSNEQIETANIAIKEFRPRTLKNFLLFPFIFFKDKYYLTSLLAFLLLPLSFLWVRKDKMFRYILMFVLGYFAIWFFFISHQKRFVMIGLLTLMICFGYIMSKIYYNYQRFFDNKIVRALFIIIILAGAGVLFSAKEGYFFKVKKAELSYVAGLTGKGQFYSERGMGGIYYLSEYINKNYNSTKFLPLWSDDTNFFLDNGNVFISLHDYIKDRDVLDADSFKKFLKDSEVNFIIDFSQSSQDKLMKEWYNSDNSSANDFRDRVVVKIIKLSDLMPEIGEVIYNENERLIYVVK